MVNKQLTS